MHLRQHLWIGMFQTYLIKYDSSNVIFTDQICSQITIIISKFVVQLISIGSWCKHGSLNSAVQKVFIFTNYSRKRIGHCLIQKATWNAAQDEKHARLNTRLNIRIRINSHHDNKFRSLVGSTEDTANMQPRIVITTFTDIFGTYRDEIHSGIFFWHTFMTRQIITTLALIIVWSDDSNILSPEHPHEKGWHSIALLANVLQSPLKKVHSPLALCSRSLLLCFVVVLMAVDFYPSCVFHCHRWIVWLLRCKRSNPGKIGHIYQMNHELT